MPMQTDTNQQVAQQSQTEGVWTLADVDTDDIRELTRIKQSILLEMDDEGMSIEQVKKDMAGFFSLAGELIGRHFNKKEIASYAYIDSDGSVYTFYDFKEKYGQYNSKKFLRRICEIAFGQYDKFIKDLGGGLPTQRVNRKKKSSTASSQSLM